MNFATFKHFEMKSAILTDSCRVLLPWQPGTRHVNTVNWCLELIYTEIIKSCKKNLRPFLLTTQTTKFAVIIKA